MPGVTLWARHSDAWADATTSLALARVFWMMPWFAFCGMALLVYVLPLASSSHGRVWWYWVCTSCMKAPTRMAVELAMDVASIGMS